jgi:hypothetical protein
MGFVGSTLPEHGTLFVSTPFQYMHIKVRPVFALSISFYLNTIHDASYFKELQWSHLGSEM